MLPVLYVEQGPAVIQNPPQLLLRQLNGIVNALQPAVDVFQVVVFLETSTGKDKEGITEPATPQGSHLTS